MKVLPLLAIGLAGVACGSSAAAQLIEEQVVGSERLCVYQAGRVAKGTHERKVGIGQPCPAHYAVADRNRPAPPTAGLQSSSIVEGKRRCVYGQRGRTWTFAVPLGSLCAPTAGMAAANGTATASD